MVTSYLLFAMELKTRSVHLAGCTPNPDERWMRRMAINMTDCVDGLVACCVTTTGMLLEQQPCRGQTPLSMRAPTAVRETILHIHFMSQIGTDPLANVGRKPPNLIENHRVSCSESLEQVS